MLASTRDLFAQFSERSRLFIVVLLFCLGGILLSLWLGGLTATALFTVPALYSILQVTKGVWTPEGGGKSKLGLASLGVALAAAVLSPKWKPLLDSLLAPLYEEYPALRDLIPAEAPSVVALVFLLAVIFVVNYLSRDQTAMKEHPTPLEKEFPGREYKHALRLFKKALENDLNSLDMDTNWNAAAFVPLDAEVEVQSGSKRLKKITDLLSAIRSDRRSSVFLVLGDPGSGKSVALRKLCRDLLGEVEATGKVPLYVNLKEWEPRETWTAATPPTGEQVYDFVLGNLKARTDIFSNAFLDTYFKRMFDAGRLFIVLDSFDEIPAVLDVGENSWLIDRLSDVLFKFLNGAHESRGILASRIFRRPTRKFDARTTLEIRPFTESKIVQTLKNYATYNESFLDLLFNRRPEFVPVARNPFAVALISDYAKENGNTLPASQAELYSSYIMRRLGACRERMAESGLTDEGVVGCATDIADVMFTTEHLGLEAPVRELKERLPGAPVEEVVELLLFARLARLGGGHKRRFSFAHRRFNEYFVVQRLKQQPDRVPADSIPTDSRWRDALVLYCEVAEEARATAIAEFCWSEVVKMADKSLDMRDPQYLRSLHCLRFLKEAFRARAHCIGSFRDELAALIRRQLGRGSNLLVQKFAVEAVGLLRPEEMDSALLSALDVNNPWIDETALKSCHYLPRLSDELNRGLIRFLDGISIAHFLGRRRELMFSLKLSNVFSDLRRFCLWRLVDTYCLLLCVFVLGVLSPLLPLVAVFLFLLLKLALASFIDAGRRRRSFAMLDRSLASFALLYCMLPLMLRFVGVLRPQPVDEDPLLRVNFVGTAGGRALLAAGILLSVPWYEIRFHGHRLLSALRKLRPVDLLKFLGFLLLLAGGIGLTFLIEKYVRLPNFEVPRIVWTILGCLVFGTMAVALLRNIFIHFREHWRDRRRLAGLDPNAVMTRRQVADHFFKFKTDLWRLKYVRFLRNVRVAADSKWPDGKIPREGNDEASTLLAKLEEGWLGLDR